MIKASELRQGNYVNEYDYGNDKNEIIKIDFYNSDFWRLDYFEPIIIIPEILKKSGFELVSYANINTPQYLYKNDEHLSYIFIGFVQNEYSGFKKGCYLSYAKDEENNKKYGRYFQYLHQLQNLYFALTGEEIQINL